MRWTSTFAVTPNYQCTCRYQEHSNNQIYSWLPEKLLSIKTDEFQPVHREVSFTLKIPKSNINPSQRTHKNRPTPIKPEPISRLPNMLDIALTTQNPQSAIIQSFNESHPPNSFATPSNKKNLLSIHTPTSLSISIQTTLNSLSMTFQRCLTPTNTSGFVSDLDE